MPVRADCQPNDRARGDDTMNFNIENSVISPNSLSWDGSLAPLRAHRVCNTVGGQRDMKRNVTPPDRASTRAQKSKSPCITIGIYTFGRFGDGSALTGGGF